jgi:hypothetical protein
MRPAIRREPPDLQETDEETIMLKTISAALLAISVLAAPAMAADTAKTTAKTTQAPAINSVQAKETVKPAMMNANARMGKHHHRFHRHHRYHKRFHRHFHKHPMKHMTANHMTAKHMTGKHMGAIKAHKFSKLSIKHVTHAVKRG